MQLVLLNLVFFQWFNYVVCAMFVCAHTKLLRASSEPCEWMQFTFCILTCVIILRTYEGMLKFGLWDAVVMIASYSSAVLLCCVFDVFAVLLFCYAVLLACCNFALCWCCCVLVLRSWPIVDVVTVLSIFSYAGSFCLLLVYGFIDIENVVTSLCALHNCFIDIENKLVLYLVQLGV